MHVCLFDIDGTLIKSGGAGKAAFEEAVVAEFGLARLIDGVPMSGRTDRGIARDLLRLHGIDDSDDNWKRFRACYLRLLPDLLAKRSGEVCPGVERLLETLDRRDDVALGLLTGNMHGGADEKLAYYGLNRYFSFGGYGDRHFDREGAAREALEATRDHLGANVDVQHIWVIGDTPRDIHCARAIGAKAVAVCTGWDSRQRLESESPDLLLDDLTDPAPLFAMLRSG